MLRLSRAFVTCVALTASTEVLAETHLVGIAAQSCETWTANRPTSGAGLGLLYQQWLFGFLSGASFADPDHDPLNGVDAATITAWADKYCQDNAAARIADAVVAFVRAHRP